MKKNLLFIGILTFSSTLWAQEDGSDDDAQDSLKSFASSASDFSDPSDESEGPANAPAPAATVTASAPPSVWGTKSTERKGMWVIGVDAAPVLNFGLNVVNLFNNTGQDATNVLMNPSNYDQTFGIKYYLRDNLALRGSLRIGSSMTTSVTYYEDPHDVADPEVDVGDRDEISDTTTASSSVFGLGVGAEWRHSFGRFEGFCGAEGQLGTSSSSTETDYGWKYKDTDNIPNQQFAGRTLSEDYGTAFALGARGFLGIEYFLLPELSLSAEYGMGAAYSLSPNGVVVTEVWETNVNEDTGDVTGSSKNREAKTDASQVVAMSNDLGFGQTASGSAFALRLNFHF